MECLRNFQRRILLSLAGREFYGGEESTAVEVVWIPLSVKLLDIQVERRAFVGKTNRANVDRSVKRNSIDQLHLLEVKGIHHHRNARIVSIQALLAGRTGLEPAASCVTERFQGWHLSK